MTEHLKTCPVAKASTTVEMAYAQCACVPYTVANRGMPRLQLHLGTFPPGTTAWFDGPDLILSVAGKEPVKWGTIILSGATGPESQLPILSWVELPVGEQE